MRKVRIVRILTFLTFLSAKKYNALPNESALIVVSSCINAR